MAPRPGKECCLCGDIGFSKDLVLCPICGFRLQHTYCSRSYPGIDMATWRCEWCVHDQEKRESGHTKRCSDVAAVDHSPPTAVDHSPPTAVARDGEEAADDVAGNANEEAVKKALLRRKREDDKRQSTTPSPGAGVSTPKSKRHKNGGSGVSGGSDRWRKLNCNSPSTRVIGRRYKLLADVLC